jgi:hypothetical protein
MFINHQMRAMDRLFENMMLEFDASTPLKAVEKAFPKEGNKVKMLKAVSTEYEYQKCGECGTLHLVEVEEPTDK